MANRRCRRDWSLLAVSALLSAGAAWAVEHPNSTVPDEMLVVYAQVIFRHGQRSRLKKTLASEFGENAGVTVSLVLSLGIVAFGGWCLGRARCRSFLPRS